MIQLATVQRCGNCDCFSVKAIVRGGVASGKCFRDHTATGKVHYVNADQVCDVWRLEKLWDGQGERIQ